MAFDQTARALIEPTDAVRREGPTAASLDRVVLIADSSNAYSSAAHAGPLVRDLRPARPTGRHPGASLGYADVVEHQEFSGDALSTVAELADTKPAGIRPC